MAESKQKQENQHVFYLQKVYVKDASFESPMSPQIFTEQVEPDVDVQMQIKHAVLDQEQGFYEGVLAVTVTAKLKEKTAFLAEVHQAGIFQIKGVDEQDLPKVLGITCPNILLPFVREAMAEVIAKGGFPQLLINPVNFEALYQQNAQHSAKEAGSKQESETTH